MDGHANGVLAPLRWQGFAFFFGEKTDRGNRASGRARVTDFGVQFHTGHIREIDFERAPFAGGLPTAERIGERTEQYEAARDDGQRDEIVGGVFFHAKARTEARRRNGCVT